MSDAHNVRVVSIYSTNYTYRGNRRRDVQEELLLGGLSQYYKLYEDQLPRLLPDEFVGGPIVRPQVKLVDEVAGMVDYEVDAMLFALPSNQVVLAISFIFSSDLHDPRSIVRVLEQSIEAKVVIHGRPLAEFVRGLTEIEGMLAEPMGIRSRGVGEEHADPTPEDALLPERHQLVFLKRTSRDESVPTAGTVHEIVYRKNPPFTEEFARPKRPEQLNQERLPETPAAGNGLSWRQFLRQDQPTHDNKVTLGVVTPYVSLLYGHKDYIENSVIVSTVHAVGTASRFRQIWHNTYAQVRQFRETKQEETSGRQTRASLEELADSLGNLEFDLTFSVEFPLMRIESFQSALYEAMDLEAQARTLSQMFNQVSNSVRSEITAINVREQRRDNGRQKWNAFAATTLSLLGVSVGFVIAFLGINTTEVPGNDHPASMWDGRFATLYLVAGLFALTPAYFICLPYLRDWIKPRHQTDFRALWLGPVVSAVGAGILIRAFADERVGPGHAIVLDAIQKAVGFFALSVGISLVVAWVWYRWMMARARRAA